MGLKRMFLHAWKLVITHPITNQRINLKAPLPTQLENVVNKLRAQA